MATRRRGDWIVIALCFQERNKSRISLLASELLSVSQGSEISLRREQVKKRAHRTENQ